MKYLRQFLFFLVYSNLFIAACSVLMVQQTAWLFLGTDADITLTRFVLFSTLCSYSFHYYFTTGSLIPSPRIRWQLRYRTWLLLLFLTGLAGAAYFFYRMREHWFWLTPAVIATFLYSAPKLPHPLFRQLRKVAIGKTIFLSFVWMYVTAALPLLVTNTAWNSGYTLFAVNRFFFIYCICILFDLRDKADDKAAGIRSLITFLNDRQVTVLFVFSWTVFAVTTFLLGLYGISRMNQLLLLLPGIITALLYNYARKNFSDILYFVVLDGLMVLSALLMLIGRI
ncbi:MAG: hypothetical protein U0U70_07340 [Chitinophagaceae bacterium]